MFFRLSGTWREGCWLPNPLQETIQLLPPEQVLPSFCHSDNTQDTITDAQVSPKPLANNTSQLLEESTLGSKLDNHVCNSSDTTLGTDSGINTFCSDIVRTNENVTLINEESQETCNSEDVKDAKNPKERHISIDSARDSGIGDGSNLTDGYSLGKNESLRNLWEPKVKHSLADRLPKNRYYFVHPSRYIFPGAEVFYDPDEKYGFSDDDDSSSDSDLSDSESELDNTDSKFDTETDLDKLNKFIGTKETE